MKLESGVLLLTFICLFANVIEAIRFNLHPNTQKCLRDEINANMLVVGYVFLIMWRPNLIIDDKKTSFIA
jgi:hypothetical protein